MKKVTVPAWLFLGGLVCFALFFFVPTHPDYFSLAGWLVWACAYLGVVAQNYKKKPPLPALGVWLHHDKQPILYRAVYFLLFFMGAFAMLFFLLIYLFPK